MGYRGRFAPSPTGPLHQGSLVAALASWLDARSHGGAWLIRIEDLDRPRCPPGTDRLILDQLQRCGLSADESPVWQSSCESRYANALDRLGLCGRAYPCGCTRKDIDKAWATHGLTAHRRHGERVYPGTCRSGLPGKPARAWRLRSDDGQGNPVVINWTDRRLGPQHQDVTRAAGDFVLRRADGLWAYQLAVVLDDAEQGITHVVRGEDLADNTPRQILLQQALGLQTPHYLHTPLVLAADGHKLSKQNGATALDLRDPLASLRRAGAMLSLPPLDADLVADWLAAAVQAWPGSALANARVHSGMMRAAEGGNLSLPITPKKGQFMTTTPSGLQFEDTVAGSGATAAAGQRVQVHYTGWLYDPTAADGRGSKFDSSKDRGSPFAFQLGAGQVIQGWDEGVQGMKVGGTRVLQIPAALGYGERGAGGVIPPNATLIFEVDLLSV